MQRAHLQRYRQLSTCAIHMKINNLWKTSLLRADSGLSTLPALPEAILLFHANPARDSMHLVACARPTGALEDAPRTSLRPESDGGRWDGFWCAVDGAYYTRCTEGDGAEKWFRLADDEVEGKVPRSPSAEPDESIAPLRSRSVPDSRRVMLLVTRSVGARGMLVGAAHRKPR